LKRIETLLSGVCILEPVIYKDDRGFFTETFNSNVFEKMGIKKSWVQDNHSKSVKGVLRGLHWQIIKPQAKLIRVISGKIFDVVVDIRQNSPTYKQSFTIDLSSDNQRMLFIPEGFAHGFLTLTDTAEILYKVSDYYSPEGSRGFIWNDPDVAIQWPIQGMIPIISKQDSAWDRLDQLSVNDLF
jgi:dTDP-4-dehydrorhamnose 3,5-epimerase